MDHKIKIHFGGELANLYEVGYLSIDLYQLITFSDLIEQGEIEKAKEYFGKKPKPMNRYHSLLKISKAKSEIVDVRKGSIELMIAGISVSAAIIMPLVQVVAQKYLNHRCATVTFEFSPQDESLKRMIDAYAKGEFGRGQEGFDTLFTLLQRRNYNVSCLSENIYQVEYVVDKYAQRMVRTINRNR